MIIIFITGLHKKPQGRSASVASVAGPFTTKKNSNNNNNNNNSNNKNNNNNL
jgi:hypothetical protein